jgi:hypothetical protein
MKELKKHSAEDKRTLSLATLLSFSYYRARRKIIVSRILSL